MPKRKGHLYERFLTKENFIRAEYLIGKNKPDNRMARHIMANSEKYGEKLFNKYSSGEFHFHESRRKTIVDSYKGKTRTLKIPILEDQAVQMAWLNIATPYLERKNYYYNCGSIPKAGQTRAVQAVKKWMKNKRNKYAAVTDIKKFYDTCPHSAVMNGLRRIFKDERFLKIAEDILASMSDNGIGLAIGHPTSHWFANVALMDIDLEMKRKFGDVKFARFMDDSAFVSPNKRRLRQCIEWYRDRIKRVGMRLKKWSRFNTRDRPIGFLSYRFFHGYTLMQKSLMVRISRRFRKASEKMNVHVAKALLSYCGIMKWCDSFNFKKKHVFPYVKIKNLKRMVSQYDKNLLRRKTVTA